MANGQDMLVIKASSIEAHADFVPDFGDDNSFDIGTSSKRFANIYGVNVSGDYATLDRGLNVSSALSTDIPLVVQGAASQSANLQEW